MIPLNGMIRVAGMPVIESTYVAPGAGVIGFDPAAGHTVIAMHPLDMIAVLIPSDPHTRLQAAMEWILGEAHRKLDAAAAALGIQLANYELHDQEAIDALYEVEEADEECRGCGGDGVILGDNYGWTGAPREYPCDVCVPRGRPEP